jgi:hypothetical protein
MHTLRRTATVLVWPTIAWLGAACDRLDPPTAAIEASITPDPGAGPGKVTGGGQIDVVVNGVEGTATFGFNANLEEGTDAVASGHLNYVNHVSRVHLNCKVTIVGVIPGADKDSPGTADFAGYECSPNSSSSSFAAEVEDNGEPGREEDVFTITYTPKGDDTPIIEGAGSTIRRGNIQVHQNQ